MENLKQIVEGISSFMGAIGVLLFGYILLMGLSRKAGKTTWSKRERERRISQGKPNINLISGDSKTELPWKDQSLIQGGFNALLFVGILLSYVVAMLLWEVSQDNDGIAPDEMVQLVGILMAWPVFMGAFFTIMITILAVLVHKLPAKPFYPLFVVNLIIAISSFLILRIESSHLALGLQTILFLVVSCLISYGQGISDGIMDADLETRFPLVSVVTVQGNTMEHLRLYEKTDTDYRFIGDDGVDLIIPGTHIAQIKHVPEKNNEKAV